MDKLNIKKIIIDDNTTIKNCTVNKNNVNIKNDIVFKKNIIFENKINIKEKNVNNKIYNFEDYFIFWN